MLFPSPCLPTRMPFRHVPKGCLFSQFAARKFASIKCDDVQRLEVPCCELWFFISTSSQCREQWKRAIYDPQRTDKYLNKTSINQLENKREKNYERTSRNGRCKGMGMGETLYFLRFSLFGEFSAVSDSEINHKKISKDQSTWKCQWNRIGSPITLLRRCVCFYHSRVYFFTPLPIAGRQLIMCRMKTPIVVPI